MQISFAYYTAMISKKEVNRLFSIDIALTLFVKIASDFSKLPSRTCDNAARKRMISHPLFFRRAYSTTPALRSQ
jgi:hypothetical protein